MKTITFTQFKTMLHKIKWTVIETGSASHRLHDHKGNATDWEIWFKSRIEIRDRGNSTVEFGFKNCNARMIGKTTVCLYCKNNRNIFINFHNFNIKDES